MRSGRIITGLASAALLLAPALARGASAGSLDPSFGSGGVTAISGGTQLFAAAAQGNGDVVVAGDLGGSVFVERLTAGGQPDPSFGSGGRYVGPAGVARGVVVQADGRIVVAGTSGGMFVTRLNANGTPDTSFGSGGTAHAYGSGQGYGVAVSGDGHVVVAGSNLPIDQPGSRVAVARFTAAGALDPGFGSGGTATVDLGLPYAGALGVAVQPDGKVVLAGQEQGSTSYAFYNGLIIRLTTGGALDSTFNGNGVVSYHHAVSGYDALNAVAVQADGKIVAAGADVSGPYALLVRVNANGSYDKGFGDSGAASLPAGSLGSSNFRPYGAYGVAIAGGGRIFAGGAFDFNGTDLRGGAWLTGPTGLPDGSFGTGGTFDSFTGSEACAAAVAPDGSLILVGHAVPLPPSTNPCLGPPAGTAFVARFVGYGPPPVATTNPGGPTPTPSAAKPTATSGSASSITQTSAVVSGQVNPNGSATAYGFQYGTTTRYGAASSIVSAGTGTSSASVKATLRGLPVATTYHYRLVATNAGGVVVGADRTFRTLPRLSAKIASPPSSVSAGKVARSGLALVVSCNQACLVSSTLTLPVSTVKSLHLGHHSLVLGSGSAHFHRAEKAKATLKLNKAASQALRKASSLRIGLLIVVKPASGGSGARLQRTLTLHR